jgi:hypothetical protein
MTRALRLTALASALVLLAHGTLGAQEPKAPRRGLVDVSPTSDRHGLWLEGGLGWGEESYKFGGDPYSSNLGKPTFKFLLGGTVNPYLRLGAEVNTWWNSYQDEVTGYEVHEDLTHLMGIARIYPMKNMGLYFKGGLGVGWSSASVDYGNSTTEAGFAQVVGAGWEVKVSKVLFITPAFDWYWSQYEKRGDATLHERLLNFSVGLTFQPGH